MEKAAGDQKLRPTSSDEPFWPSVRTTTTAVATGEAATRIYEPTAPPMGHQRVRQHQWRVEYGLLSIDSSISDDGSVVAAISNNGDGNLQ